jgi:hypothetical protein
MSVGLTFDMMLDGKVMVINEVLIMIDNRQRECLNTRVWPSSPGLGASRRTEGGLAMTHHLRTEMPPRSLASRPSRQWQTTCVPGSARHSETRERNDR